MRNYGIPPINGTSELLAIEPRSLPHGATRLCQLANQCPAWFTFFLRSVTDYQDLELNNAIQGSWISQNRSIVTSTIEVGSAPENILVKAILSIPDRNIHQYRKNAVWGTLSGSSIVGSGDPTSVTTPDFLGQIYIDSLSDSVYISNGLTNTNWYLAGVGGGSS